jgi:hypothetical protein
MAPMAKISAFALTEHARSEIIVLRLANGDSVRSATAGGRGPLLLERLGRLRQQLALPIGRRHEILCSAAEGTASRPGERAADRRASSGNTMAASAGRGMVKQSKTRLRRPG